MSSRRPGIISMAKNLYVHFPFCRRKCSYCALHSRAGSFPEARRAYIERIAAAIPNTEFDTVYFGGGSPALCDLSALAPVIVPRLAEECEFTVELHPLDVSDRTIDMLLGLGVNRVSMGVQSLENRILDDMGRGYTAEQARSAFEKIHAAIPNAGIDLIIGYPGSDLSLPFLRELDSWHLAHCSVYSLILEENTILARRLAHGLTLPDDDETMNALARVAEHLKSIGLRRYEISNYARPGFECRHNLAVWNGEDYYGVGEGAFGRLARFRTENWWGQEMEVASTKIYTVDPETDRRERTIFRLRTLLGLDSSAYPQWRGTLDKFAAEGLLKRDGTIYRLTARGTEVCDSILAELD